MKKKAMALVLALGLVTVGIVGGTMAWLTDATEKVKNTFTDSDINITLTETGMDNNQNSYKMIPGHTITKDPKVKVEVGSEDCWLFVKITESTTPDLDAYICYAIAEGWQIVEPKDSEGNPVSDITSADEIVIGRKVLKNADTKEFGILGSGNYTADGTSYTWDTNRILTKPEVTKTMMDAIDEEDETKPTLTFKAAAVQLYETQDKEFGVDAAYDKVAWPNP